VEILGLGGEIIHRKFGIFFTKEYQKVQQTPKKKEQDVQILVTL